MAHREFRDESGRNWQVWDVIPMAIAARLNDEEPQDPPHDRPERRRSKRAAPTSVATEMRDGWLAFQCTDEARRLAPIPEGWADLPESELAALARAATPNPKAAKHSSPPSNP